MKLFLKGERCYTEKCAIEKRNFVPGQHGKDRKQKIVGYGLQLREKQKARRYYQLMEGQFRTLFEKASVMKGITGENMLSMLERRLDNAIYRIGFGTSRAQARQLVRHGHVKVNGRRVNIASYLVKDNDEIELTAKAKEMARVLEATQSAERDVPEYVAVDHKDMKGTYVRGPKFADVPYPVQMEPSLVVEYYSR